MLSPFWWLALVCALAWQALALCPRECVCSETHREVDCSWRGLRVIPTPHLQHNLHALNLSHNRLSESELDGTLAAYSHLRSLDLSYNRLNRMPAALPRSLWELHVSGNRLRLLHKNDTAYHWNLRTLDLSANRLERVVLINNTLPELRKLDLSRNRFWTVPTNVPRHVETIDLSHNTLVQILPGSLAQLTHLTRFYLHGNRFTSVPVGAFDQLAALRLITLGDNPWACDDPRNITYLLSWLRQTHASVLGCPCHTWHTCGETHLATTRGWHYASYTPPPNTPSMDANSHANHPHGDHNRRGDHHNRLGHRQNHNRHQYPPQPPVRAVTAGYWPESVLLDMHRPSETSDTTPDYQSRWPAGGFYVTSPPISLSTRGNSAYTTPRYFIPSDSNTDATDETLTTTTKRTTTLRTRSVKKANQGKAHGRGHRGEVRSLSLVMAMILLLLI